MRHGLPMLDAFAERGGKPMREAFAGAVPRGAVPVKYEDGGEEVKLAYGGRMPPSRLPWDGTIGVALG